MRKSFIDFIQWKGTHAPRAAKAYETVLRRFDAYVGQRRLTDQEYTQFLYKEQGRVASVTMNGIVSALKGVARYLHDTRQSDIAPSLIRHGRYEPSPRIYVTHNDFCRLISTLDTQSIWELRKAVCMHLLWDTGIRVSELIQINLGDLDLSTRSARIRSEKNKQFRWIQWSAETHSLLVRYLGVRVCVDTANDALFLSLTTNARVTSRTVQRWVEEVRQRAHINKKISPHSFRHGKAHAMLQKGATVKDIQVVLGHSELNPRAAFQYIRMDEDEQRKVLERFV